MTKLDSESEGLTGLVTKVYTLMKIKKVIYILLGVNRNRYRNGYADPGPEAYTLSYIS